MLNVIATQPFEELSVVRLRNDLIEDGHLYRAGSVGTIVFVHGDHAAYEVELFEPAPAVVTLKADELTQ